MAQSKPLDLTAAELELIQKPMQRGGESAPLSVPPGTQVPVHLLDPAAADPAAAARAPTLEPPTAGYAPAPESVPGPHPATPRPGATARKRGR